MLKYEVPSRLHITLCDMNGNLGRINGGIGFLINDPKLVFYVERSKIIEIYSSKIQVENQEKYIYEELVKLREIYNLDGIKIMIKQSIPEHSGFGSKSITKLSIAKAYLELYDKEVDMKELATILKRGGTSGISVNIIEKGGFIFDGGRKVKDELEFNPSSAQNKIDIPPVLFHRDMLNIPVYILIPKISGLQSKKEVDFFKKVCPIKEKNVEKLSRVINSQILPSICENDLGVFCKRNKSNTTFKMEKK